MQYLLIAFPTSILPAFKHTLYQQTIKFIKCSLLILFFYKPPLYNLDKCYPNKGNTAIKAAG